MEWVNKLSGSLLTSRLVRRYTQGRVARDVKSMTGKDVFLKAERRVFHYSKADPIKKFLIYASIWEIK